MKINPYSCEQSCKGKDFSMSTNLIVITGGPGAGKTAVLEFVRKVFCEHIAILPEAATILFGGGFWRLDSASAKRAEQRAIYHIQSEMQNLVLAEKKWTVGLCDRGTLDGMAYWPGLKAEYCDELKTNVNSEYAKYKAVVHLSSPSLEGGYNHQNPLRIESAEEAFKIDQQIHEVWKGHPNYQRIESTENFIEKVHRATQMIQDFLPQSCRKHLAGLLK